MLLKWWTDAIQKFREKMTNYSHYFCYIYTHRFICRKEFAQSSNLLSARNVVIEEMEPPQRVTHLSLFGLLL